jgi:hypothetical protein
VSARSRLAAIVCAGLLGAAALGALSSACNSLSGIGDFTVGGEQAGHPRPDGGVTAEAQADAPGPGHDATAMEGSTSDVATPPDAPSDRSAAGDGAEVGPEIDGGDGGPGLEDGSGDAADGGVDTGGGTGPCDGGTALVVHSNGLGETFSDCAPLGTFNVTQALQACVAHTGDAGACTVDPISCAQGDQVCGTSAAMCTCWRYNGNSAGKFSNSASCSCVGSASPTWN